MAKDCDFKAVTAEEHRDIFVRDSFITGLASNSIRLRLLEKSTLQCAYEGARQLEYAHNHAMTCNIYSETPYGASADVESLSPTTKLEHEVSAATSKRCFFCRNSLHQRFRFPARDSTCNLCSKRGHFQKVCRSTRQTLKSITSAIVKADDETSRTTTVGFSWASTPASGLTKSTISILVNGVPLKALVDAGSSESYISSSIAKRY
uniref:Peptidase A2 domain-containing protein n=1 Tax=Biomphalaria glabrata TaxID=6526 RepID=A0A2C9LKT8_BIOGL